MATLVTNALNCDSRAIVIRKLSLLSTTLELQFMIVERFEDRPQKTFKMIIFKLLDNVLRVGPI